MAKSFSSGERRDDIGLSGKKRNTRMPTVMVMTPQRRNMICQDLKAGVLTCWKP